MPRLSVIILSYNTKDITNRCIVSLNRNLRQDMVTDGEIIVIDNNSKDGSVEMLKEIQSSLPDIKVIFNRQNVGYPAGNNQGLKYCRGKYILFLNSDVLIDRVNFKRLLNYLDARKEVGALTVKVKLPDGSIDPASHRGFPTIWNSFCYFAKLEKIFKHIPFLNRIFGGYHLTSMDLRTIHEIDSPSGAFYLAKGDIIRKLKGFDESYFMYAEDLDLSYRIKKAGYSILYYPFFSVTHLKYASGLKNLNAITRKLIRKHFYSSMKMFYKKHYASNYAPILNNAIYMFIDLKERIS